MKQIFMNYDHAINYMEDGDVLLFRGKGLIAYILKKLTHGSYSHVGLASILYVHKGTKQQIQCLEFREWRGGRAVSLRNEVKHNNGMIDVYRASTPIYELKFNVKEKRVYKEKKEFNGVKIIKCMRNLTGLPYGWLRILWLAKYYIIGLRLFPFSEDVFDDNLDDEIVYPICSTAVAHCFQEHYVDLTHNRSNKRMEPADIARSPILNYLFTLKLGA